MSWWKKFVNKARGVFGAPQEPAEAAGDHAGGCAHGDAIHLRQGTAEFEWFVARGEFEAGNNLAHGMSHLANLLVYDPAQPEWIELLEQYLAATPDPEALIPRGKELYVATEALRAYLWQRQGKLNEAVELLVSVSHAQPDARYLEAWALDWLEPPGAIESLPADTGLQLFSSVLSRFPEARRMTLTRLRHLRRWAKLSERFAPQLGSAGIGAMLRAGILRKAGLFDAAVAAAKASIAQAPDWHSYTALGLILREQGNVEPAEEAFRQAAALDAEDVSAMLEAGDMFAERQLWPQAIGWYEQVLAKQPRHPWAEPARLHGQWKETRNEDYLRRLIALAKQENNRAIQLCNLEFYGELPEPGDATANLLRQMREKALQEGEFSAFVSMSTSSLEAPSNFLALRMEIESHGEEYNLAVTTHVPTPDPRWPIAEVKYVLWDYDGTDARPNLPPPAEDVSRRIAELAGERFDDDLNWASASRLAEDLGPERVGEVLATMVHPPALPEGKSALAWLPRVQHAAAQVAAQIDRGWEGSVRREALYAVLHGPQDWATVAAIRALARVGIEEPAFAPDIHDAFQKLLDHRPEFGYCCWEEPLYRAWLELPHLFDDERAKMQQALREIEESQREG